MKQKLNCTILFHCVLIVIGLFFQPNVVNGQVKVEKITSGEKFVMHSKVLNEDRTIKIWFPEDYGKSGKKYPVLYLLDAEYFFQQAASAVQFLSECDYISNHPIPQMIIVGIVNIDRNRDYTPTYAPEQRGNLQFPTSGKADKFTTFLSTELIPYIHSNYKTQSYRILAGWSLGGLFTVHTFFENPQLFSAYLAVSPSLWWDKDMYVKRSETVLSSGKISNKPLTVTVGSLEGGDIGRTVRDGFARVMKEKLNSDFPFTLVEIPGEGHYFVPYKAIYQGLISLYSDWQMPFKKIQEGFNAVDSFYKKLSKKYGYEITISQWAYRNLINRYNSEKEWKEALKIAEKYILDYPQSSWAYCLLGLTYQNLNQFELAKEYYQKAIKLEKSRSQSYSENILVFTMMLQNVKEN
jgi:predicted alpha/beta superfamily hydrolase